MKFLCIVNKSYVDSFIHVSNYNSCTKTLRLSFWIDHDIEPRISQLVGDIARSYGIRGVTRLEDAVVAKSPGYQIVRRELNYSLVDTIEKVDNLLLKIGLIYK